MTKKHIISKLVKKANGSRCKYRVSAIGFNRKGEVIGIKFNYPRFSRVGGSIHAEIALMKSIKGIAKILICRIGEGGKVLPISPCENCSKQADKFGIKIETVSQE